jgi:uncharacterized protein (DUF983 family)
MMRFAASMILSVVLFFIQAEIVMWVNNYSAIQFMNVYYVFMVCIVNFFISFSLLSQLKPWLIQKNWIKEVEEE